MKFRPVVGIALAAALTGCATGPVPVGGDLTAGRATLVVPYSVALLKVDGREAPMRVGRPGAKVQEYAIPVGERAIEIQFSVIWYDTLREDHTPVRSAPMSLSFTAAPDHIYRIEHSDWRTLADAEALAARPDLRIVDAEGATVSTATAPAATAASAAAPAAAASPAPTDAVRQMDEWWKKATPQEREAFLRGILPADAQK